MIDISNAKWDFSKEEKYVINWFDKHGFSLRLDKQFVTKTIFIVSKNGITDKFELPQGVVFKSISGYMDQYERNWKILCELHRLRSEMNGDLP